MYERFLLENEFKLIIIISIETKDWLEFLTVFPISEVSLNEFNGSDLSLKWSVEFLHFFSSNDI